MSFFIELYFLIFHVFGSFQFLALFCNLIENYNTNAQNGKVLTYLTNLNVDADEILFPKLKIGTNTLLTSIWDWTVKWNQ